MERSSLICSRYGSLLFELEIFFSQRKYGLLHQVDCWADDIFVKNYYFIINMWEGRILNKYLTTQFLPSH